MLPSGFAHHCWAVDALNSAGRTVTWAVNALRALDCRCATPHYVCAVRVIGGLRWRFFSHCVRACAAPRTPLLYSCALYSYGILVSMFFASAVTVLGRRLRLPFRRFILSG